jgi:hypothetical protein
MLFALYRFSFSVTLLIQGEMEAGGLIDRERGGVHLYQKEDRKGSHWSREKS